MERLHEIDRKTRMVGILVMLAILSAACAPRDDLVRSQSNRRSSHPKEIFGQSPDVVADSAQEANPETRPSTRDGWKFSRGRNLEASGFVIGPSPWDVTYSAQGQVRLSRGMLSRRYLVPAEMDVRFNQEAQTLIVFGESQQGESWHGVGMILHLDGVEGRFVRRLSLITPYPEGGTYTFGFPLRRAVKWLSLEKGEASSSLERAGRYLLRFQREAQRAWRIDIKTTGDPEDWFTRGWIRLEASRTRPPWRRLAITFELENAQGVAEGRAVLSAK